MTKRNVLPSASQQRAGARWPRSTSESTEETSRVESAGSSRDHQSALGRRAAAGERESNPRKRRKMRPTCSGRADRSSNVIAVCDPKPRNGGPFFPREKRVHWRFPIRPGDRDDGRRKPNTTDPRQIGEGPSHRGLRREEGSGEHGGTSRAGPESKPEYTLDVSAGGLQENTQP